MAQAVGVGCHLLCALCAPAPVMDLPSPRPADVRAVPADVRASDEVYTRPLHHSLQKSVLSVSDIQPVRQAVNDRGLFIAGWFGVREKYCSGWKFTIVYDQAIFLYFFIPDLFNWLPRGVEPRHAGCYSGAL